METFRQINLTKEEYRRLKETVESNSIENFGYELGSLLQKAKDPEVKKVVGAVSARPQFN